MKKITLIILLLAMSLIGSKNIYAQIREQLFGTIISSEETNISNFDLDFKIYINDSVTTDSLNFILPNNIIVNSFSSILNQQYTNGDSIIFVVNVSHTDTANLPFYPEELALNLHYTNTLNDTLSHTIFSKLYFTPYNSVEIWSISDFLSLPRRWYHPSDDSTAQRVYINANDIPQTNMSDISSYERDSASWNDWWIDDFREVSVDGLAYTVLMKPIPVDSLTYYEKYGDRDTNLKGTYTGTVSGRITAKIYTGGEGSDYDDRTNTIGLGGLRIRLREQDHIFGQAVYGYFGETYTNDDGTYEIPYSKFQSFEGGEVELYLEIIAEDDGTHLIKSKPYGISVIKEKKAIGNYSQNAGNITFDLHVNTDCVAKDAYPPIHFTKNIYNYFDQEGVTLSQKIRFRIGEYGCFANCYVNSFSWPAIYLSSGKGLDEETVRHEFGHVIMYKLQDNEIKIPYGENGVDVHSWGHENTGLLAWIEGWADAISMIMDAADYIEYSNNNQVNDPEYAYEHSNANYELRNDFENSPYNAINNGLRSEYFIACTLYDLWDGPAKGLPNSYILGNNDVHAYNDDDNWNDDNWNNPEIDDVEFSLAQICAPLQSIDASNINDLRNISQYYNLFISQLSCEEKAKASKAFRQNKILWDIDDYNMEISVNGLSSDMLRADKDKYEDGCFRVITMLYGWVNFNLLNQTWTDTYWVNLLNENSINNYHISACQGMPFGITDNYWVGVNKGTTIRETNIYLNDQNNSCYNLSTGIFYTCGGTDIVIRNGKIELGATDGSKTAELEINDGSVLDIRHYLGKFVVNTGSVLRIKDGGTLIIYDDGVLEVNGTGEVIIEEGGQIIYNEGSIIELNDSNSILEIAGELHIASNTTFTFTGNGYVKFSNPGGDATNNIFCGSGSSIVLQGSGKDDKILEVQQSTVRFPDGLSSLELRDGKIEMGSGARMLADGNHPITFNNVKITSDSGVYNAHRSFFLWGQPNISIDNCTFEYGKYGLYNYTYCGAPLTVTNSEFKHNQTGLYMYDKGLSLDDCSFHNNSGNAIQCDNMSYLSDFTDCSIFCNNYGIVYQGSSSADLNIDNTSVSNNTQTGVFVNGAFDLDLTCNIINNNRYGIHTQNGTYLRMENYARNDVSDNQERSLFLNYAHLYLENGYNQLQSVNDDYAVLGYSAEMKVVCGTSVTHSAEHNRWENNTIATPVMNGNYALWVYNCWPPTNVILDDGNPDYQVCIQFNPLSSNQIGTDQTSSELSIESTDSNIEAQLTSMSLESAELTSESEIDAMISQYISFISGNIDNHAILSSSVVNKAWADMHDLVDKYYKVVNLDSEDFGFNQSIDQIMQLNEQLMLDADAIAYYEYALDNALLERLRGNFDESLLLLDNLILDLDGMEREIAYVNSWICHIDAEREVALGNLTPDEFMEAIETCNNTYENAVESISDVYGENETTEESESSTHEIHIVPNPNNGNFTVEITDCMAGSSIRISNVYAQPVFTQTFDDDGSQTVQITGLASGHYTLYYLENNMVVESESIVVE